MVWRLAAASALLSLSDNIDQSITDVLPSLRSPIHFLAILIRTPSLSPLKPPMAPTPTFFCSGFFSPHIHIHMLECGQHLRALILHSVCDGGFKKVLEMYRASLAHERQSIIQAARITDLEHELARLRAGASSSPGSRTSSNGSGPVASAKTAANSDAQAPTTQKGRWWALGWR